MEFPRYPNKKGRPRGTAGPGARKNCRYASCKSDTKKLTDDSGIYFIAFAKPCLIFRKGPVASHCIKDCAQCSKATLWLRRCCRKDKNFYKLQHITKDSYICSLHFVGNRGPTPDYPDPVPADASLEIKLSKKRKPPQQRICPPQKRVCQPRPVEPANTGGGTSTTVSQGHTYCSEIATENQLADSHHVNGEPCTSICLNSCDDPNSTFACSITVEMNPQDKETTVPSSALLEIAGIMLTYGNYSVSVNNDCISLIYYEGITVKIKYTFFELRNPEVMVYGNTLPEDHNVYLALKKIPFKPENVINLLKELDKWKPCIGNNEVALVKTFAQFKRAEKGRLCHDSVHSVKCVKLVEEKGKLSNRCWPCRSYRHLLKRSAKRTAVKVDTSKEPGIKVKVSESVNYRFLTHRELLMRLYSEKKRRNALNRKCKRLEKRLLELIRSEEDAMNAVDDDEVTEILEHSVNSLQDQRLIHFFVLQQLKAVKCKDKRSMRWHPLMIKLCLYLQQKSPSCYKSMRNSGLIMLPSKRTVRNYGKISCSDGFNDEVHVPVLHEIIDASQLNDCEPYQIYCSLV